MAECTSVSQQGELLLVMRITGGSTAILSILGAGLIIFTYAAFKNLRTTARQLLVNLSIADIIISASHFIGILANYESDLSIPQLSVLSKSINHTKLINDSRSLPHTNALCSTQGALTAFGTVASFLWSMLIAVYMLVLTQSSTARPRKVLIPIIYTVSWGIPVVIVVVLAALDFLGYNPEDSPGKLFPCSMPAFVT